MVNKCANYVNYVNRVGDSVILCIKNFEYIHFKGKMVNKCANYVN